MGFYLFNFTRYRHQNPTQIIFSIQISESYPRYARFIDGYSLYFSNQANTPAILAIRLLGLLAIP